MTLFLETILYFDRVCRQNLSSTRLYFKIRYLHKTGTDGNLRLRANIEALYF